MKLRTKLIAAAIGIGLAVAASAQMMYGNTFPFWNVTGALTVGGTSTLTGAVTAPAGVTGNLTGNVTGNVTGTSTGAQVGTTTNDSAAAGNVGQVITATVAAGAAVAGGASTVGADVTSISLTAGDWDVSGTCDFVFTGMTTTTLSCGLGVTTGTLLTQAGGSGVGTDPLSSRLSTLTTTSGTTALDVPVTRVSLASTTTIYLVSKHTYSAGSFTQYGTIRARRER